MRHLIVLILLFLMISAFPIHASSKQNTGEIIFGPGAISCGKYFFENSQTKLAFFSWAQGYMTGLLWAMEKSSVLIDKDPEALRLWIDNYCKANPLKSYHEAVKALIEFLVKN